MSADLCLSKVAGAVLTELYCLPTILLPGTSLAVVLQAFNPVGYDQLNGSISATGSSVIDLTGNQRFQPGVDGSVNTSIGDLQAQNRIVDAHNLLGADRLDPGPANFGTTIPDPATGGNTTFQVYNPSNLVALPPIDTSTTVADVVNVQDNQYINTRVADVSDGGTLNVHIGQANAASSVITNNWTMAAKQSLQCFSVLLTDFEIYGCHHFFNFY